MTQTLSPGSSFCNHCSCHFKVSEGQLHGKLCYNHFQLYSLNLLLLISCSDLLVLLALLHLSLMSALSFSPLWDYIIFFFSLPSVWHVTIPSIFQYVSKIDPAVIHISPPPLLQPWSEPYLLSSEWCCSLKPELFLLSFLFLSNPVSTKQQSKLLKP